MTHSRAQTPTSSAEELTSLRSQLAAAEARVKELEAENERLKTVLLLAVERGIISQSWVDKTRAALGEGDDG